MNNFALLQALAFEPKQAFATMAERPRVLFPIALLLTASVGLLFWYFSIVDTRWLMDQTLLNNPSTAQMTEQQLQLARNVNPAFLKWSAVIGGAFVIVLTRLLEALYYLLAGKITNVQRSYRQWLALASWTSLPAVLAVIPAAIVLLTSTTTQIDQGQLQVLSLNNLFFHRAGGAPGHTLLVSINLLQFVGMYLATLGVRLWSGRSWLFSIVFTFLPAVLIFGTWAYFALGRS